MIYLPDRDRAHAAAQKLRREMNSNKPKINPQYICLAKGWKIYIDDLEGADGYTFWNRKKDRYMICIDPQVGVLGRIVWTLSHEIGHIYLRHHCITDTKNISSQQEKYLDTEADWFAEEFLMPEEWVKKLRFNLKLTSKQGLARLKNAFGVSWESLTWRLDSLGIQEKAVTHLVLDGSYDYIMELVRRDYMADY